VFFKKPKAPDDKLNSSQLIARFRGEVQDAIDTALDGRESDRGLCGEIERALRTQVEVIATRRLYMS
jgi:hypothetical protein